MAKRLSVYVYEQDGTKTALRPDSKGVGSSGGSVGSKRSGLYGFYDQDIL